MSEKFVWDETAVIPKEWCGHVFYGYLPKGCINGMDFSVPRICDLAPDHTGSHGYRDK